MSYLDHVFAVILAGGGGTRLWPKSRIQTPKQFLSLSGKKTMLQLSAQRLKRFIPWSRMIVVTNQKYQAEIIKELPNLPKGNIILEPQRRETAMAMLIGAKYAHLLDPKAVVVNAAADHIVVKEKEFIKVMKTAAKIAAKNTHLLTVGITPTHPATGFGYIKIGKKLSTNGIKVPVFVVESFTEKPNVEKAKVFLATKLYFWNANMYVWSAEALFKAFDQYMPQMYKLAVELGKVSKSKFKTLLPAIYAKADTISIDYAISEKAQNLLLIPGNFGWNDVGEWQVVYDLGEKDNHGNVTICDKKQKTTIVIDSQNNLVHADGRLIALLGVNDMIVVDTKEILLIAPKSKSQEVKKIVEQLKKIKAENYL